MQDSAFEDAGLIPVVMCFDQRLKHLWKHVYYSVKENASRKVKFIFINDFTWSCSELQTLNEKYNIYV